MITVPEHWLKPSTALDGLKEVKKEIVRLMKIYEHEDSSTYHALEQILKLVEFEIKQHSQ